MKAALDGEFRSTQEIAERSGVLVQLVAPLLRFLERDGEVEHMKTADGRSLWRKPLQDRNVR